MPPTKSSGAAPDFDMMLAGPATFIDQALKATLYGPDALAANLRMWRSVEDALRLGGPTQPARQAARARLLRSSAPAFGPAHGMQGALGVVIAQSLREGVRS